MDIAIAVRIGSTKTTLHSIKKMVESIEKNIGDCSYRFILSIDPKISFDIKEYIKNKKNNHPERFELLPEETIYWAEFINKAIEKAEGFSYFIKAHDDIVLQTEDFFPKVKNILDSLHGKIAWVSFNETSYLDGHWNPSTRSGYHRDYLEHDAWNKRKMFQFHNLPENWWVSNFISRLLYIFQIKVISKIFKKLVIFKYPIKKMDEKNIKLLDFPSGPVRCHAPWNTFVLIKMSVLKELGLCENWQTYNALFVDEDWGLRALEKKYWNIWIPEIEYLHLKPLIGGDRSQFQIKNDSKRVGRLFEKKWGFSPKPNDNQLELIRIKHYNDYIPWSIGRDSFDWDYAK